MRVVGGDECLLLAPGDTGPGSHRDLGTSWRPSEGYWKGSRSAATRTHTRAHTRAPLLQRPPDRSVQMESFAGKSRGAGKVGGAAAHPSLRQVFASESAKLEESFENFFSSALPSHPQPVVEAVIN